jgi:hypothetical protein
MDITEVRSFLILAGQLRSGRFPRRIPIVAGRKSDNKKVSFDRAILFELFMIPLQMRGMQETKEFGLDLGNKCSARISVAEGTETHQSAGDRN